MIVKITYYTLPKLKSFLNHSLKVDYINYGVFHKDVFQVYELQ